MNFGISRERILTAARDSSEARTVLERLFPEAFELSPGTVVRFDVVDNLDYMITDGKRGDDTIMIQIDRKTGKPNGKLAHSDNFTYGVTILS